MQILKKKIKKKNIGVLKQIPKAIYYSNNKKPLAIFNDNSKCNLACIKCQKPLCMFLDNEEINKNILQNFPHDRNNLVCPVNAITWNESLDYPVIDNEKCIKCGLCLKRCPIGALYYDNGVKLNISTNDKQDMLEANEQNINIHNKQILQLSGVIKDGQIFDETNELLGSIYNKLSKVPSSYHNLVVRNILISLGLNCEVRRIGDVYTRMDAIYSSLDNTFGAIEVEFGKDTLDAVRAILDDIAVLNSRYGIDKNNNKALVVCLQLPNARQGFWQVVKDINNVEKLNIQTVSIGSLLILVWNFKKLDLSKDNFYIDFDMMSIRDAIEKIIGRKLNITDKVLGIFEPSK